MSHDRSIARRRLAGLAGLGVALALALGAGDAAAQTFTSSRIVGVQSNRCVDIPNASTANGTQAQLWDCNGGTNQSWTYGSARTLVVYGNKCLQPSNGGTSAGTAVVIGDCTGQASQQWNVNASGTISNVQSGLCLDANGAATANGTRIIVWGCGSGANQRWTVPGAVTTYALAVARGGTGAGTVTSAPAGISCGATCSASYASGTTVTLTAAAASGSSFAGWSGACTGTGACAVTMTAARSVTATFDTATAVDATVSVNAGGAAAGSFAADAGFTGGSTYSTTAAIDTSLVPAPVPPAAVFQTERYGEFTYTFGSRTPGSAQSVTLYFAESYWTAAGQRTFNVAINGATVLAAFDIFAAAGGAHRAVARTFEATADASGQVVVQFTRAGGPDNPKVTGITVAAGGSNGTTWPLSVSRSGTGTGTVTSTPAGISCGGACTASYASGTTVTLTAVAATGSVFGGWSGACTGVGTCIASMTAARTVTANFTLAGGDVVRSAGCGRTPTLTSGTRTIQSGGQSRSFMIRIPDGYDPNRAYRVVFAFHWNGGTANDVDSGGTSGYTWSYYGLRAQANNSTIFVAPQGIGNGWANSGGRDLTFVDDMVRLIDGDLCVDTTRRFAMGFSYGGGMSYAIACARAKSFRAVAVYAGAQLSGCEGGNDPIAYIGFHSITDPVCSISGGRSLRDRFVRNNGCTPQNPPEPAQGTATHIVTSYAGCRPGYPVVWAAFSGAGHTPAPVDGQTSDSGGGDRTWTKAEAWRFFTQF
jgi:poly(3-hydroxybutyrate) depolymerase